MTSTCSCCKGEFADSEITKYNRGTVLRLCSACYDLVDPQSSPRSLEVQPMNEDDLELVLGWRNNPKVYENLPNQNSVISWENHTEWYENRSSDRKDYVIRYQDRRIGVVSLDEDDFVSIYIGEYTLWGQGIGSRILEWLTQRHYPDRSVQAEVHTENSRLKQFFEQCGFSQSARDGEWIVYKYGE